MKAMPESSSTTYDITTYYPNESAPPKPYVKEMLPVGDGHTLYVAEYGNPNGIPVVLLHGGPGAGSSPKFAKLLDPTVYRLIMLDQRGCGESKPFGALEHNTTQHILADLEKIRVHKKVDKWILFGGSWGSTLALLYAQKHPERVTAMALRGIFLARPNDIYEFFNDNAMAAKSYSNEWAAFKAKTATFVQTAGIQTKTRPNGELDMIDTYYQLLHHKADEKTAATPQQRISYLAAMEFARWEMQISTIMPPSTEKLNANLDDHGLSMGRIEIQFSKHDFFLSAKEQILHPDNIARISGIPTKIIQGIHDQVCPANQAATLAKELKNVVMHRVVAGHSTWEPAIIDAFVKVFKALPQELGLAVTADAKAAPSPSAADTAVSVKAAVGGAGLMPMPAPAKVGAEAPDSHTPPSGAPAPGASSD